MAKPSWIFRYFLPVGFPRRDLSQSTKVLRRVTADVLLYSCVMRHTLFLNVLCFEIMKRILLYLFFPLETRYKQEFDQMYTGIERARRVCPQGFVLRVGLLGFWAFPIVS